MAMVVDPQEEMVVSKFINPHLFWLRKINMSYDKEFILFEQNMNRFYKQNVQLNKVYKPKVKEVSSCAVLAIAQVI